MFIKGSSGKYITQALFNMCAITAAKCSAQTGEEIRLFAAKLAEEYGGFYQDANLAKDIAIAGEKVTEYMLEKFPPDTLVGGLLQIQYCVKYYYTDGTKKEAHSFDGMRFNAEATQLPDKVAQCRVDVSVYSDLVLNGTIPLVPDGWQI